MFFIHLRSLVLGTDQILTEDPHAYRVPSAPPGGVTREPMEVGRPWAKGTQSR